MAFGASSSIDSIDDGDVHPGIRAFAFGFNEWLFFFFGPFEWASSVAARFLGGLRGMQVSNTAGIVLELHVSINVTCRGEWHVNEGLQWDCSSLHHPCRNYKRDHHTTRDGTNRLCL